MIKKQWKTLFCQPKISFTIYICHSPGPADCRAEKSILSQTPGKVFQKILWGRRSTSDRIGADKLKSVSETSAHQLRMDFPTVVHVRFTQRTCAQVQSLNSVPHS